jgi:macrolide transport system ATP-binding/permease protein
MSLLSLRNVAKEYRLGGQTVPVLSQINLEVEPGEFMLIMGQSGSGKTTLMNLLGCLDRPTAGEYLLHGTRVDSLDDEMLSRVRNREIGFVFQNFYLLPDNSILHNIALPLIYRGLPLNTRKKQATEMAQSMGIGERTHHKPTEVSGGQAQRAAIARALVGNPRLILADEPTGNLDSKTGQEIIEIFRKLHRQGNTIIMVTHNEHLAEISERIIRLADGMIVNEERRKQTTISASNGETIAEQHTLRGLRLRDLLSMSVREGLLAHPLRTLLTVLGVLFGVAAVIAMMAINEGARQEAIEQIQQMGLHNIRLRSTNTTKDELREARKNLSFGLNQEDMAATRTLKSVRFAAPIKEIAADIAYEKQKPKGRIIATLPVYQEVANFYVERGRFLNDADERYYRRVCVIGKSFAKETFSNEEALGKQLYLGPEVFIVIGVMQGKNVPQGVVKTVSTHDLNHDVYIPLATAIKRFKHEPLANELDEISVMVHSAGEVQPTAQLLAALVAKRHHQVHDFELVVPEELLRQSRKTQEIFDLIMVCIAGISLIVGGIGIMNIMLATVTERIREIGIRRAIGASKWDVLKQFLVEAVAISMIGGALGIMCGAGFTWLISVYTGWHTIVSVLSIVLGFGVSTVVGMVFGIYPAWQAALLDPITALRSA